MTAGTLDRQFAGPSGWIAAFVVLASIRILAAWVLDHAVHITKTDLDVYDALARNLLGGHGFVLEPGGAPILWRPPIYPLFVAGVWGLAGAESLTWLMVAQSLVDAATAVLTLYLGRRLFGTVTGVVAAVVFIGYPLSVYYTLRVMSEPCFTLTLMVVVVALERADRDLDPWACALVGAGAALNALVRPAGMYLAILCVAWLLFRHRRRLAAAVPRMVLLAACFAAVIAPWTWRNHQVTGALLPIATGGGYGLWVGNRWDSLGREDDQLEGAQLAAYERDRAAIIAEVSAATGQPPYGSGLSIAEDRAFGRRAIEMMSGNPLQTAELFVRKFGYFWFDVYLIGNRGAQAGVIAVQGVLLAFSAWGAVVALRRRIRIATPLLVIGYFMLLHAAVVSTVRYSIPLVPLLAILAAFALDGALKRVVPAYAGAQASR